MGDVSNEPTMEEILSSIKRVIEDSEAAPARRTRPARTTPARDPGSVLELSERAPFPTGRPIIIDEEDEQPVETHSFATESSFDEPEAEPAPRAETIVSQDAADASRGALEALSRLVIKPDVAGSDTLEGLVREMLRPLLREWLDTHLPGIVETMVAKEIARISGRGL